MRKVLGTLPKKLHVLGLQMVYINRKIQFVFLLILQYHVKETTWSKPKYSIHTGQQPAIVPHTEFPLRSMEVPWASSPLDWAWFCVRVDVHTHLRVCVSVCVLSNNFPKHKKKKKKLLSCYLTRKLASPTQSWKHIPLLQHINTVITLVAERALSLGHFIGIGFYTIQQAIEN